MNLQYVSKAKEFINPKAAILVSALIVLGLGLAVISVDRQTPENQTDTPVNETDVNVSEYYDNETGVCWSPEVNQTNASELEQCVSNQSLS